MSPAPRQYKGQYGGSRRIAGQRLDIDLMNTLVRYLLIGFACLCVALGVIGIFVPGLPTTVFILMAGWAAARSSPRFLGWLERHRLFGPMLRNWRETRSVSRKAKWCAALTMSLSAVILFIVQPFPWLAEGVTLFMVTVLIWLWRRPEPAESIAAPQQQG